MTTINNKNMRLKEWLKKNNEFDICDKDIYKQKYDFNQYYETNDIDMQLNDHMMVNIINDIENTQNTNQFLESYKNKNIYLHPNKNIYECNKIFKIMIDQVIDNNMHIKIPQQDNDTGETKYKKGYIFTKNMKHSFYNFI